MHLRRAVLLFAIVLGLTAIASSVAPPPRDAARNGSPPSTTEAPPPPRSVPVTPTQTLAFGYPPPGAGPRTAAVGKASHAVIAVRTSTAGEVSIPRLGLTGDAAPATSASFDVLLSDPGRYDVVFQPAGGEPSRVGTVVVRE